MLAMGAHKSRPLQLDNEDVPGVYPSIEFLKSFNLRNEQLAKGRVGIIGGGNSAIDAARMALRQRDVESVTILYRRTRNEMPAFAEEIEATDQEGIKIQTLVTPTKILVIGYEIELIWYGPYDQLLNRIADLPRSNRHSSSIWSPPSVKLIKRSKKPDIRISERRIS